jgi:SIR2-like domain
LAARRDTNYDSLFLDRYNQKHGRDAPKGYYRMEVVGRDRGDCQRVLNSAHTPDSPLLWAIQGFFDSHNSQAIHRLCGQLTVGHTDYRRQTQDAPNFRRAFAEVYRSKILFFLGSAMSETYFHDLFDEIIQLYGNCSHVHHALIKKGIVSDTRGFERQFGVRLYEWEHTSEVTDAIKRLTAEVTQAFRPKTSSWSYWLKVRGAAATPGYIPDIEMKRSRLPDRKSLTDAEAIALSAGDGPVFGGVIGEWIQKAGLTPDSFQTIPQSDQRLRRAGDQPYYAVIARDESGTDVRDPRVVADLMQTLLTDIGVNFPSVRVIHVMLLASGPGRQFPQHVALSGMVRGYKTWREKSQSSTHLCMHIHLVDPELISLLTSGRLDIIRLLNERHVSFWIEVMDDDGDFERYIESRAADTPFAQIVQDYGVPVEDWCYTVIPRLRGCAKPLGLELLQDEDTLRSMGVFFGSTIRFSRRKPSASDGN